jgi:hypothetical protein
MNEVQELIGRARSRVISIAAGRIGTPDASSFWSVCGHEPFDKRKAWCGIFALWCLTEAGLADFRWEFGKGFLYRLPRTSDPQPGDIGYIDAPFQHHLIVEHIDTGPAEHRIQSIDGNTPLVSRKTRPLSKVTAFYSIEPLILAAHAREAYPDPPEAA